MAINSLCHVCQRKKNEIHAVADELGNSVRILRTHYVELVTREAAAEFWSLRPA